MLFAYAHAAGWEHYELLGIREVFGNFCMGFSRVQLGDADGLTAFGGSLGLVGAGNGGRKSRAE